MDAWPIVGRAKELAQLSAAVFEKRGAVITGAAGVGKTTLAVACLEVVEKRGMALARTSATRASQQLPFGAFAAMLPPDADGDDLRREDHGALLRRYGRALVERAKGLRLVVFVDDAHLLDNSSATLFHQLAMTESATVLATVRSDELAPDAVVDLWKDGQAERIEVSVLEDTVIEELLPMVLGGPVDAATIRQLTGRSRGNPMFLRELVTGALEAGTLVDEGGIWRLRGQLRPSGRLVELAAQRLGDLTGPERTVLELLTLGEPLGQATLAQLTDPGSVETLEHKGLITSRIEGRRVQVWLGHPIYGDVVRVGITALHQRALARSRAEVVEAVGGRRREDTLLLASWRLVGGGSNAELLFAGATAAQARHDYLLAERLARAAVSEGGGFEARFLAAEAAHFQGRPDQAERELAALATQATSDTERARVAIVRFENSYLLHGRADLRLVDDVADAISDPFWLDELLSRRFFAASFSGEPRAAVNAAANLLQGPRSGRLSIAHVAASYGLVRVGRLEEAIELLRPSAGASGIPAINESWDQWIMFDSLVAALVHAGRLGEAEGLLLHAYDQVVDQPEAEARAHVAHGFAVLHLEQGLPLSAFRRASESYMLYLQLERTFRARWPYILAVLALALSGSVDRATETLAAHDALGLPTILSNETDLLRARAWTAAARGDLPAARRQLEAAADLGETVGDLIGATNALHSLARLGHARQVAARLADLASQIDGPFVLARAAYANAVAARDSEALEKVSQDFEDLGAILYAAEASAEAAVILRRAGQSRKAAATEQKAARLLARCEGATTPPVETIAARVRLTPGELNAALQAAAGRTNKEIASDMYLSIRTVESHLQRVYEKLGISGRHDLADALRDVPSA
jgi:DNA-binding CsgD family transcriptional regulator/type II secretory pathway predicted ATPase ExeA